MIRVATTLFLVYIAQGSTSGQTKADKEDQKKLQGKWQVVSVVFEGKDITTKKATIWTIKGDKIHYSTVPSSKEFDEIKLNAAKKPKEMDVRTFRSKTKNKSLKAIYMMKEDRLTICVDVSNKGRPTAFTSKKGSGRRLLTLKRIKSK